MPQIKKAKRNLSFSWLKLIAGCVLIVFGLIAAIIYFENSRNILAGMITAVALASGAFLLWQGLKIGDTTYSFSSQNKPKYTGKENAIIIFASHNKDKKKDVPLIIRFAKLTYIPEGARLHYVRNLKKHFFELYNDTTERKLRPVILPDKKPCLPEQFRIPATMQEYKDCMEYNPPSTLQKVAPGIMLGAMALVGILMVMTGG